MPNREALSVLAAGESLGSALATIGATIKKSKDDRTRDSVLKEFEDPSKTFFNPDGTPKNPIEIATRFSTGIGKLLSVGAKDEALGLQQYLQGANHYLDQKESNMRTKAGIEVRNPEEAAKLFPGQNWNADNQESLMRSDMKAFTFEGNKPAHWYDIGKRQEKQPDGTWHWMLTQSNDRGERREVLGGIAPTPPDPYAVKRSVSSSYNINEARGGYDTYFSNADGTKTVLVKGGQFEYNGKKYKVDQMSDIMGEPMFKTPTGEDNTESMKLNKSNADAYWEMQKKRYVPDSPEYNGILQVLGGMDPADVWNSEEGRPVFSNDEIKTMRQMQYDSGVKMLPNSK